MTATSSPDQRGRPPLAERMRPRTLDAFAGQEHLLGEGNFLRNALAVGELPSLILWGPPGVGKTTLARLLAEAVEANFTALSAVMSSVKDLREAIAHARDDRRMFGRETVLFIDEIHRFNKAQQDALLPHVEQGTVTLIGATTENPGFEVNQALRSRAKVVVMEPLDTPALSAIIRRALTDDERGLGAFHILAEDEVVDAIAEAAAGDARAALNTLETCARAAFVRARRGSGQTRPDEVPLTLEDVATAAGRRAMRYDKSGDGHYRITSAFIKSMRGSDPDAALYYMNRMLEGGEDPNFILRRIVIFASEDIGLADPMALVTATHAMQAFQQVGMPEGGLAMTQAVLHCATAPKSNAVISSYKAAQKLARDHGDLAVPKHIAGASGDVAAAMGWGQGYKYPHEYEGHYVREDYLPPTLAGTRLYTPSDQGYEATVRRRLERWRGAEEE